jgi:hypothetical protein
MEIPYEVGGSVASSAHGVPRTTLDIDIVVELKPEQIDGVRGGGAANVIHLKGVWKFDLFPLGRDEYSRTEFAQRKFREIRPDGGAPIEYSVASAEDTILRKLEWYCAAGETSDRQWNDLRGVVRAATGTLEIDYLRRWAAHLKIGDLLEKDPRGAEAYLKLASASD